MSSNYASYAQRVLGYLVDVALLLIPPMISGLMGIGFLFSDTARPLGVVLLICSLFWFPVIWIYNEIIRQGKTGQTVGKSRLGTKLIKEQTGQPIGVGYAILRLFLMWLFGSLSGGIYTIVDLIFPAFDKKRQRVTDKMLRTIVVTIEPKSGPPIGGGKNYSSDGLYD